MPNLWERRLAHIEQKRTPPSPLWPVVVEMELNESQEAAWLRHVARYGKPRGKPHIIFAPAMLSPEQWLETYGWTDDLD